MKRMFLSLTLVLALSAEAGWANTLGVGELLFDPDSPLVAHWLQSVGKSKIVQCWRLELQKELPHFQIRQSTDVRYWLMAKVCGVDLWEIPMAVPAGRYVLEARVELLFLLYDLAEQKEILRQTEVTYASIPDEHVRRLETAGQDPQMQTLHAAFAHGCFVIAQQIYDALPLGYTVANHGPAIGIDVGSRQGMNLQDEVELLDAQGKGQGLFQVVQLSTDTCTAFPKHGEHRVILGSPLRKIRPRPARWDLVTQEEAVWKEALGVDSVKALLRLPLPKKATRSWWLWILLPLAATAILAFLLCWRKIFRRTSAGEKRMVGSFPGEPKPAIPPLSPIFTLPAGSCPICRTSLDQHHWQEGQAIRIGQEWICQRCLKAQPPLETIGDYRLLKKLGKDSFGEYFLALAKPEDRLWVLHRLPRKQARHRDPSQWKRMRQRFQRAQSIVAELRSPDLLIPGELRDDSPLFWYYPIPYEPVLTLRQVLRERGSRFAPEEAIRPLAWLARVLALLHRNHLVHRDLKPAHLLCHVRGHFLLTGFSLLKRLTWKEKILGNAQETLAGELGDDLPASAEDDFPVRTVTGRCLGTPAYLAPEQVRDAAQVTGQADVWSWGVMALELLGGTNPFEKKTVEQALKAVLHYRSLGDVSSCLPADPAWVQLLEQTLVPEPCQRISSAALVRQIEKITR